MISTPTAQRAPHDPRSHLDAWRHVFSHLDANPLQLLRIGRTCTTFADLAADNELWLPHTPLATLGLSPVLPRLPEPRPQQAWSASGASGCLWNAGGTTFVDYDDAVAYRDQLWARENGLQPAASRPQALPRELRGPTKHGVLRHAFQQRMAHYVARAESYEAHADFVLSLLPRLWSEGSVGSVADPATYNPWAQTQPEKPDFDLEAALERGRHDYDLWRALMDRPELRVPLARASLALQAEPSLTAPYLARRRGFGSLRAPAVTADVELFFRLAPTDPWALASVHRSLGRRLDVAVWALKHFDTGLHDVDNRMRQNVCYPQLHAEVPQNSPIWRQPGGAALIGSITSWESLCELAYAAV